MEKPRVETRSVILVDKYTKENLDRTMEILNEFFNSYEICDCVSKNTAYDMWQLTDSFSEMLSLIKVEE